MPPKPPSSASTEKRKGGTKEENSTPYDREREKEEEAKLAREFMATSIGQSIGVTDEMEASLEDRGGTSWGPDNPPCDGCLKPFGGALQCSKCESAFYCGRDCQVAHWSAGHKTECKRLKKENELTAQRVLEDFKEFRGWNDLDVTGVYKAAVRQGLHDKIREVMELDKSGIVQRYQNDHGGACICYVQCVMKVLFRGNRAEGNDRSFSCMDGGRIKGYVRSHPDALDAWLRASVQLTRAVTRRATRRKPRLHHKAHDAAQDVWSGWCTLFTSKTASRAILTPFPGQEGAEGESPPQRRKRVEAHVQKIVEALGEGLRLIKGVPDQSFDPGSVMETMTSVTAAKILYRCKEYGIRVDVEGILHLTMNTHMKKMFRHVHIHVAKKMIENGGDISAEEMNAIMARASPYLHR